MSVYSDRLDALVDAVNAAAIATAPGEVLHATRDPVQLSGGQVGLLVVVSSIDWATLAGDGLPVCSALLVGLAGDSAMSLLLEVVDQVAGLIGADTATRATWTPPGADPLPCFQLTAT
jgi:hypothetical protein